MAFFQYTKKDIQRTFKDLEVSENGLSEKEAAKRLKKSGVYLKRIDKQKERAILFISIFPAK